MSKYITINKQSYELSKLTLKDFLKLGGGTENDYYKLTGKEKPAVKVEVKKKTRKKPLS